MDSLLLSRLTKDYLNQDPALISSRERYRMGWSGSVMSSHPKASKRKIAYLLAMREKLAALFDKQESKSVSLSTSPRLSPPKIPPAGTFRPARYFSKGALENDRRKNPTPIAYLLTETNETSLAKPVPGGSLLIRSLCKGKGTLRQNKQGLVYLDVDNRFISLLLPYLKAYGLVRPPYFNLFVAPDGAHIPIISAREVAFQYLHQIEQIGQEFSFEIEGLYSTTPTSWPEVEQVWFFKLHSPELEALRRKHFLPAIPNGHAFHIAVAVKPRLTANNTPQPLPLMRINTAFIAA
jgi:hypothetical protein